MLTVSSVNQVLARFWPEWQVDREIGEGAHGIVFHAASAEEEAAVKVLRIPQNQAEVASFMAEGNNEATTRTYFLEIVNRYIDEVRIMEKLKDVPNIVQIRDYKVADHEGEIGWDIYIRMELLTPFQDYLSQAEIGQEMVARLGTDICRALKACAEYQIIHRDIKPENIFVDKNGVFKLGDFGVARQLERKTASLSQKGTYNYMAPEVLRSEGYTENVDVYSLGIVLFRLMNNNRIPFLDPNKQLVTYQERQDAFERRMSGEELPDPVNASPAMAAMIKKACCFAPEERYQTAEEMLKAIGQLETIRENDEKAVRRYVKNLEKGRSAGKRKRSFTTAVVLSAVIMAAGGIYYHSLREDRSWEPGQRDYTIKWHDEGLKTAVCEALGKEKGEEVTAGEMYELDELYAEDSGVKDISDLVYCPNLKKLDLQDNSISDISSLGEMESLTELVLMNNQVSDLAALSNCVSLEVLKLGNNKTLGELTYVKDLPALKTLCIEDTRRKDISEIADMQSLEVLDIRENQITDLKPLDDLKTDQVELIIDIEQYETMTDDVVAADKVNSLYIERPYYYSYTAKEYDLSRLSEMKWLELLSLEDIHIADDDWVESLPNLRHLSLCNAGLTEVPPIDNSRELEELLLCDNEITSVEDFPVMDELYCLDLSRNKISSLTGLDDLSALEILVLYDNMINDIEGVEKLSALQSLDLEKNRIADISRIGQLHGLVELYLADNEIRDYGPIEGLKQLVNDPLESREREWYQ